MIEAEFAGEIIMELCSLTDREGLGKSAEFVTQDRSEMKIVYGPQMNLALAIKCLAVVKKIHLFAVPAKALLEIICYLFDRDMKSRPVLFSFFKQQILPYSKMISLSWPDNQYLATLLHRRLNDKDAGMTGQSYKFSYIYDNLFGSFIGHIGRGSKEVHDEVLNYAASQYATIRVSAPFALATGWYDDPKTFFMLCHMADEDKNRTVCYAAIYALAEHYHDNPKTFSVLKRNAISNLHDFGRAAAITGLASS